MITLDKTDIQGNILRGYSHRHAVHLFFAIEEVAAARAFLRSLELTPATRWPTTGRPDIALNLGLSYRGLELLCTADTSTMRPPSLRKEVLEELGARFPEFRQGMLQRASELGDEPELPDAADWKHAHLWIAIFSHDEARLSAHVDRLLSVAERGVRLVHTRRGQALEHQGPDGKKRRYEHFGFVDGIANPEVEGAADPGEPAVPIHIGNGKPDERGTFAPLSAGEFLLGYPNESGETFPPGDLAYFVRNGTFAVFRVLEQDVHAFRSYLGRVAAELGRDPDDLAAQIVGRRRDGSPLARCPAGGTSLNDFGYASDPDGAECPLASHVRRTNPRDASGVLDVFHRIIRRGMPYGPELPTDASDNGADERGLLFIALNADLVRQFEFIQKRWIGSPTGTGVVNDRDPLLSNGASMAIPGDETNPLPRIIRLERFVHCRGGGYFFLPGIAAIRALTQPAEN